MATHFESIGQMAGRVGEHLGYSDWRVVTQEQVDLFADATDDHQWIHVDPVRAAAESPYKAAVAHGYLTLSLGPSLLEEICSVGGVSLGINYGCNRVRFPAAVPVGERIRLGASLESFEEVAGGAQVVLVLTFELEGKVKPACVAEVIFRYYE